MANDIRKEFQVENIAPPLTLVIEVKKHLSQGDSLVVGLEQFLRNRRDEFSLQLKRCWIKDPFLMDLNSINCQSVFTKELLFLLSEGLNGSPILEKLNEIELMMIDDCLRQIDRHAIVLPYLGMLPIMLLMFPSLLLVILFPILEQFLGVMH
jgi:hypothetical protein